MNAPSRKMLIVEDEGIVALDLEGKLTQAGYNVIALADNSAAALAAIEQDTPDMVLMDIRLKGKEDGIRTAEKIREKYRLPVMFVTAHADPETLQRAKITEPCGFIVKPFSGVNLHAQIEMALWKHTMERKVRESEAWLSSTFRNFANAVITTDAQGNVVLMNSVAARLTGWELADAQGRPLLEVLQIFDEKTHLPVINPLEAIYDEREPETNTAIYQLFARDGAPILIEAEISPNRDEGGNLGGMIVVFRDITARRKADERDRQIHKVNAITLMATGLARELSDAWKQMDGPLNDLIRNARGQTLRRLGDIYAGASYQHLLLDQLAALGKTTPDTAVVIDLNQYLSAMREELKKSLGRSRSLSLELEAGIPSIRIDAESLRRNLLRLAADARAAMPDGGDLRIATNVVVCPNGDQRVQLAVRDTGRAIWESARSAVFDPYYQSRPGNRNSGMVLALLYHFVALNGGLIEVETASGSERGTTFLMSFPACDKFSCAGAGCPDSAWRVSSS